MRRTCTPQQRLAARDATTADSPRVIITRKQGACLRAKELAALGGQQNQAPAAGAVAHLFERLPRVFCHDVVQVVFVKDDLPRLDLDVHGLRPFPPRPLTHPRRRLRGCRRSMWTANRAQQTRSERQPLNPAGAPCGRQTRYERQRATSDRRQDDRQPVVVCDRKHANAGAHKPQLSLHQVHACHECWQGCAGMRSKEQGGSCILNM